MSKIYVKQIKSSITEPQAIRRVLESLGLGKIGKAREHKDNNCIRGMVNKVQHLLAYELRK